MLVVTACVFVVLDASKSNYKLLQYILYLSRSYSKSIYLAIQYVGSLRIQINSANILALELSYFSILFFYLQVQIQQQYIRIISTIQLDQAVIIGAATSLELIVVLRVLNIELLLDIYLLKEYKSIIEVVGSNIGIIANISYIDIELLLVTPNQDIQYILIKRILLVIYYRVYKEKRQQT